MRYKAKLLDHFHNPRHVGVLNPDNQMVGSALVGLTEGGDVVQFQIQLNSKGFIETATFKAQASVPTTALCSVATELVIGKNLEQGKQIVAEHLAQALSLPKTKYHCALLVVNALHEAIEDLQKKLTATSSF